MTERRARGARASHNGRMALRVRSAKGAALALALSLALVVGLRAVARHYLFPTGQIAAVAPAGGVEVLMRAADGVPVRGLLFSRGAAREPYAVLFHNNRETIELMSPIGRELFARGVAVLLVEYRGYGGSRGAAPTEDGLYRDGEAALSFLAARGVARDRVTLVGQSLGSGVAAELARRAEGSRLVLITPYTSIPDLVTDVAPIVPARALLPDHFDTLSKAPHIRVPTLIIHGDDDEIVPFWMGERLADAIAGARMIRVPKGRHGDLFLIARERLIDEIARFAA